jgi:hypothetical protein
MEVDLNKKLNDKVVKQLEVKKRGYNKKPKIKINNQDSPEGIIIKKDYFIVKFD